MELTSAKRSTGERDHRFGGDPDLAAAEPHALLDGSARLALEIQPLELEEERLSIVTKHFDDVSISAITATALADFQRARHDADIANRTINMDVGDCPGC